MKCPILSCNSTDVSCERKYKAETETNRKKYTGLNVDRRRYKCNSCHRPFHTIELLEEDFERNQFLNPLTELSNRIR